MNLMVLIVELRYDFDGFESGFNGLIRDVR